MESTGVPGRIQISRTTYERVYDLGFEFEERQVEVKGKGQMQAYLVNAKHHTNPLIELVSTAMIDEEDDDLSIARILHSSTNTAPEEIQQETSPTPTQ